MRADQERVRTLLCDTVTLLCKNGLAFDKELRVQGLLGITLDENEVFIVHINEKLEGGPGGQLHQSALELAINNNNLKEKSPPKDRPAKRSRKLNHSEGPIPTKKSHINHISPKSHHNVHHHQLDSSIKKNNDYNLYNNNNVSEIKPEENSNDADNLIIEENEAAEDDRFAMRDCYNSELTELSKTVKDIPPPPPLALYGEKTSSGKDNGATAVNNNTVETNNSYEEPPDPSMGGPFITGIVHNIQPTPMTGSPEASEHSWDELGGQIGTLTQDGKVVMEGSVGQSVPSPWADDSDDGSDDRMGGGVPPNITDSNTRGNLLLNLLTKSSNGNKKDSKNWRNSNQASASSSLHVILQEHCNQIKHNVEDNTKETFIDNAYGQHDDLDKSDFSNCSSNDGLSLAAIRKHSCTLSSLLTSDVPLIPSHKPVQNSQEPLYDNGHPGYDNKTIQSNVQINGVSDQRREQKDSCQSYSNGSCTSFNNSQGKRLYRCDFPSCNKEFSVNRNLRRHQNAKHGRVPKFRKKEGESSIQIINTFSVVGNNVKVKDEVQ